MPIFQYECKEGHQFERYVPLASTENPLCDECHTETDKIWKITKRTGYHRYPYKTKNITGYEIEVTDESHEKALCKEHGVVQRDDPGFIEEDYLGYNPYTGRQEYKQSSGQGMPGCWY